MMHSVDRHTEKLHTPRCVILAAGTSSRLRPLTDDTPKCLLEIGGATLLERTIRNVHLAGITDIAIVVGFKKEKIREFIGRRFAEINFQFISNPKYSVTNNAYSLWLARTFVKNKDSKHGLLLLDSDILFSPKLLPYLLSHGTAGSGRGRGSGSDESIGIIAVRRTGRHDSEEVRVSVDGKNLITAIGKGGREREFYGESVGIEYFDATGVKKLFGILRKRMKNGGGTTEFYEASFQQMTDEGSALRALDVSAFPAIEIDTPADLRRARALHID